MLIDHKHIWKVNIWCIIRTQIVGLILFENNLQ